jgi:hypothetical protein
MSRLIQLLREVENIFFSPGDRRVYALVRMAFAFTALLNLLSIWPYAEALCTDSGIIDPDLARQHGAPLYLSLFEWARTGSAVHAVFGTTVVALGMLFCGAWARVAAFWVFVWHVSFTSRALLGTTGWDMLLRSFSFLVLISPLGEDWPLGALRRRASPINAADVPQYGLVLMRLQVLVVYWQTVLHRVLSQDPYWLKGEFLPYFLLSHQSRLPGLWVLEHQSLLALTTHLVQLTEVTIPVLLWIRKTRWWGFGLGLLLHGGICASATGLELFLLTMLMSYSCFADRSDLDTVERFLQNLRPPPRTPPPAV